MPTDQPSREVLDFASACLGLIEADGDGRLLTLNHRAGVLLGGTAESLRGRPLDEWAPDGTWWHRVACIQAGDEVVTELGLAGGRWLRARWRRGTDGRLLAALDDATSEHDAAQRWRSLLTAIPGSLYRYDRGTDRVAYFGRSIPAILGHAPGDGTVTLTEIVALIHPEDATRLGEVIAGYDAAVDGTIIESEYRMRHADGTWRWLHSSDVILEREADGRWCSVLGVAIDVTQRKQAEESLRQSDKLTALGQLAGGIAHDFNNILAAVIGYGDMLCGALPVSDPRRKHADRVLSSAQRASELTTRLLTFARRGSSERVTYDAHIAIAEGVALARSGLTSILIDWNPAPGQVWVTGQAMMLTSAVLNLCLNARDALPDGGTIHVATDIVQLSQPVASGVPAGPCLRLSVSDRGIGMPPAVLARCFEPFFSTKAPGKGTGLGLASVYGTIGEHRGHIAVTSTPGAGTTFTIHLPLAAAPTPTNQLRRSTTLSGISMLIVDDEPSVRELLLEAMTLRGHRVTGVASVDAALDAVSTDVPDVVLIDLQMPGRDGYDGFHALRARCSGLRIVAMSGYAPAAELDPLKAAGLAGFVGKPFTLLDCERVLLRAVAR